MIGSTTFSAHRYQVAPNASGERRGANIAQRRFEIACSEHVGFEWIPWNPPHAIQAQTIDPLLREVEKWRAKT